MKPSVHLQISHSVNAWFDETAPRFQTITIITGLLSVILILILLLPPIVTKVKTMPVQKNSQQSLPNVIFIVADALGANDMSLFGYTLPTTPRLEEITQKWTVFSNAQSPQTCSLAALPTLVTGRYNYIDNFTYYGDQVISQPGWLSLPNALRQAGYQTWWSGYHSPGFYHMGNVFEKNVCRSKDNLFVSLSHSWFKFRALMLEQFPFIPFTMDQLGIIEGGKSDFDQCEELDGLDSMLQSGNFTSPFFVYYHYRGPHGIPYPSGSSLGAFLSESKDLISLIDQSQVYGFYEPEDQPIVDQLRLRYDEAIANQDQQFGDFIDSLKRQGLYDSSLIILTSDHGQNFENSFSSHCTPLVSYMESHVPLLIKYPNQAEGQRFNFLAITIDIVPTILDAAGLAYPVDWLDGISLIKQAARPEMNRIVFTRRVSLNNQLIPAEIAATDGKYRLVRREDRFFFFDILMDPSEKINLLDQTGYDQKVEVKRLQQALENYRQRARLLLNGGEILSMPALSP